MGRSAGILIPEGGDDVELRSEETTFIQVKSRREHLGDYSEGAAARHIKDLWSRSLGSSSDIETSIRDVLAAVDVASIERAIQEGICEPVDFLTPLNDPNFYLGVDVEPGHIAAGLLSERPKSRFALVQIIEERRAVLIIGPSGAGKSALMWEVANALRHTVRWFQIRRLDVTDIPAIRQLIRTFRASEGSPVGFVMDDVGRNSPECWGHCSKKRCQFRVSSCSVRPGKKM